MRIFYDKQGNIIGTINGFSDDPTLDGVMIIPSGYKKSDIKVENIGLGHKLEKKVRDFEDTQTTTNVLDHKIVIKNNNFNGFKKIRS